MLQPTRIPPVAATLLLALLAVPSPRGAEAQSATVSAGEENLRQTPMGKRLATVNGGTDLQVVGSQGRWRQVVLEGWIWTPSVDDADRPGWDLVVVADGGENLRDRPDANARIAARLLEGFLLNEVEERGDWTRVQRTAWMWRPSLSVEGEAPADGEGAAADGDGAAGDGDGAAGDGDGEDAPDADAAADTDRDTAAGGAADEAAAAPADTAADAGPGRMVVEGSPIRLRFSPTGDTVATVLPGADLAVRGEQGDWTRVTLQGWVRTSDLVPADSAAATRRLTPADLREQPDRHRGRRVRWTLQFVSLERAGPERTDFYEGEPFVLARPAPGTVDEEAGRGFVYLAVPPEMVGRVEALRPLQEIDVLARVRTGRSALMGAPVLDLLELR